MKKMIITGNVGRDPEMRADQTGAQFATFSVAVSVGTKDNPKTDWIDVSCNNKLADIARNYVKKGTKVLVEGFPGVNAYINKDNQAVGTIRLSAHNIELLSRKEDDHEGHAERYAESPVYQLPENQPGKNTSNNGLSVDDMNQIPF